MWASSLLLLVACRGMPSSGEDSGPADTACTAEVCNGRDDDCDGAVDEDVGDARTWYVDEDRDGHGTSETVTACERPEGAASLAEDCDDADSAVFPGAPELCGDGRTTDCDGAPCRWHGDVGLGEAAALRVVMDEPQSVALSAAAGVGDVDGDGFDDVLFGADHHTFVTEFDGGAFLFGRAQSGNVEVDDALAQFVGGPEAQMWVGHRVGRAGDVDANGLDDVLVLAESGGPVWLALAPFPGSCSLTDHAVVLPTQGQGSMGDGTTHAAGPGDLNGDGFDDILHSDGSGQGQYAGALYVQLGPILQAPAREDAAVAWFGEPDSLFGRTLRPVGDLTGDGLPEVATSALNTDADLEWPGGVFVSSLPAPGRYSWTDMDAILLGYADYQGAGLDFAGGSDVDGDGYNDLLVGANTQYGLEGELLQPIAAWLVSGPIDAESSLEEADAQVTVTWGAEARRGAGTALPGDMDGDGFGEVAVGLRNAIRGPSMPGAVALFYGPVQGQHLFTEADAVLWGESDGDYPAAPGRLDAAGDFDGDGFGDLVLSAYFAGNPGSPEGGGWVVLGQSL